MSKEVPPGLLFVISSPSGAGKTTLARRLAADLNLRFSVSFTTRSPRSDEVDGRDYRFVGNERFDAMVAGGEFAEWAMVHGNRYGTSITAVEHTIESGTDCLFDIDFQGGRQIRRQWPQDSVLCFILPPSMAELERRLRARATDAPEVIARRLAMACQELEHYAEYDYLVVNDSLDRAYEEMRAIYVAARAMRKRREGVARALLAEAAGRRSPGA
ncbi:MAG: guanylate kinase [Deltaproteobacteria bacterium]|nr:guanylate kinase [Deltaproteobacteria bacterium]